MAPGGPALAALAPGVTVADRAAGGADRARLPAAGRPAGGHRRHGRGADAGRCPGCGALLPDRRASVAGPLPGRRPPGHRAWHRRPFTNSTSAASGNAALALNLLERQLADRLAGTARPPSAAAAARNRCSPDPDRPTWWRSSCHRRRAGRAVADAPARPPGHRAAAGGGARLGDRGGPRPASTGRGGPVTGPPPRCGTLRCAGSPPGSALPPAAGRRSGLRGGGRRGPGATRRIRPILFGPVPRDDAALVALRRDIDRSRGRGADIVTAEYQPAPRRTRGPAAPDRPGPGSERPAGCAGGGPDRGRQGCHRARRGPHGVGHMPALPWACTARRRPWRGEDPSRAGPGGNALAAQHAGPVHPGPDARRRDGLADLRREDRALPVPGRPGLHQPAPRR